MSHRSPKKNYARQRFSSSTHRHSIKLRIFGRDENACVYCGVTDETAKLQLDHVVPLSRGGTDHESNLVTACPGCNMRKADMTLDEWNQFESDRGNKSLFNYLLKKVHLRTINGDKRP